MILSGALRDLRLRALRRRVWYSVLDGVERGIVSLTIATVDRVKSTVLAEALGDIVSKLREALVSPFKRHVERYGREKAGSVMAYLDKIRNYDPYWGSEELSECLDFNNQVRCARALRPVVKIVGKKSVLRINIS